MNLKLSTGFLFASVAQAFVIWLTESLGLSALGASLTPMQLLTHIGIGQVAGFILAYLMDWVRLGDWSVWTIGTVYGVLFWWIGLAIQSALGTVRAPWAVGFGTVLSSLVAFIVFGVIAAARIRSVRRLKAR